MPGRSNRRSGAKNGAGPGRSKNEQKAHGHRAAADGRLSYYCDCDTENGGRAGGGIESGIVALLCGRAAKEDNDLAGKARINANEWLVLLYSTVFIGNLFPITNFSTDPLTTYVDVMLTSFQWRLLKVFSPDPRRGAL